MKNKVFTAISAVLLLFVLFISSIDAAVIGIDLGEQTFKIGLIAPGKYEMVMNEQSQRKTPNQVGWFREERIFGSDAFNIWVRNPKQVYSLYQPLVGSIYRKNAVNEIGMGALGYSVSNDTDRNTFKIKYNNEEYYTPEEILAMTLRRIKELTNSYIQSSVKDCVIAVPPWLTQTQRQAVLDAAQLAGLNVLSLVNNINAASLNFATDRDFERNQTAIFFDMGAKSTKLSLVHFSSYVEQLKNKKNRTVTNNVVKSVDWDENLGGLNFDMVIVNYLKALLKKQDNSIDTDDLKLTIKLLKEATKMKETLSANQQAHMFLGSLVGDLDFSASITRKEFEELSAPLLERAVAPLKRIIEDNGLTPNDIDFVLIIGGCSRIPAVQNALKTFLKRENLDKHLNGDESIASGAAFYAASLSHFYRVKEVRLKDITPYAINVKLVQSQQQTSLDDSTNNNEDNESSTDDDETSVHTGSSVTEPSFFRKNNRINIKKSLTFYTNQTFSVNFTYADLTPSSIAYYTVSNLPVPSDTLNFTGKPKVICSIRLNSNGMAVLEKAEAEITVFTQRVKHTTNNTSSNDSTTTDSASATTESAPVTELVSRVHRIPLNVTVTYSVVQPLTREQLTSMNSRLNALDIKDKTLKDLRQEKNSLESFLYETRDKLSDSEEFQACSTPEEREKLLGEIDIVAQWLSEANDNNLEDLVAYQKQHREIRKKGEKIFNRVNQKANIPVALEELQILVSKIKPMLANLTRDMEPEDAKLLIDKIESVAQWLKEKSAEFESADFTKELSFSTADIKVKFYDIDKAIKDQMKKRRSKPKTTVPPKTKKPTTAESANAGTDEETTNANDEKTTGSDVPPQQEQPNEDDNENTNNEDGGSDELPEVPPKKSSPPHDEL